MDQYDELYAISDIHLGGKKTNDRNFQIFKYGDRLTKFIRRITNEDPERNIALVLNGDIFDSLAEDCVHGYVASSEKMAIDLMRRIETDPSFVNVWQALQHLVQTPNRTLILVIGNHDIELALPAVQTHLINSLCGNTELNRMGLIFSTAGNGYTCMVGNSRVFCTHGNELDAFNWVDYNRLGQLGNAMNAGRSIDQKEWQPNAGTKLVVDVMNIVKQNYPFVDVLKPEKNAIASVLFALDRETFSKVNLYSVLPIVGKSFQGNRVVSKLLSDDGSSLGEEEASSAFLNDVLGKHLRGGLRRTNDLQTEDDLLRDAEGYMLDSDRVDTDTDDDHETLGAAWGIVQAIIGRIEKSEALRLALLDWIEEQDDFNIDSEDATYKGMLERIGSAVDFVITGHTHMPKKIQMSARQWYFNTGTWIRTLRFTRACLDDKEHFKKDVWAKLKSASLDELDKIKIRADGSSNKKQNLLYDRTNTVRITSSNEGTKGELLRVIDNGDDIDFVVELGDKTELNKG